MINDRERANNLNESLVMAEESDDSYQASQKTLKKEKLVNSFHGIGAKDTLAIQPDIYKNKRIEKYRVNPSVRFNYAKYNQER